MAKRAYHLYFEKELIKEPIMYQVARDNDLLLNIRLAKITHDVGEATIELEGEEEKLARAELIMKERGVKVTPILGDIVEG